jgi:hypothetical protein
MSHLKENMLDGFTIIWQRISVLVKINNNEHLTKGSAVCLRFWGDLDCNLLDIRQNGKF